MFVGAGATGAGAYLACGIQGVLALLQHRTMFKIHSRPEKVEFLQEGAGEGVDCTMNSAAWREEQTKHFSLFVVDNLVLVYSTYSSGRIFSRVCRPTACPGMTMFRISTGTESSGQIRPWLKSTIVLL